MRPRLFQAGRLINSETFAHVLASVENKSNQEIKIEEMQMEEDEDDTDRNATSSIAEGQKQDSQEISYGDISIRFEHIPRNNSNSSGRSVISNDLNLLMNGADEFQQMIDENQEQHDCENLWLHAQPCSH